MASLLVIPDTWSTAQWKKAFAARLKGSIIYVWGEDDVLKDDVSGTIEALLVWKPPMGLIQYFPNVKVLFNLGAGVDAILKDTTLPPTIPLVRLVDPNLNQQMREYIICWVLYIHRQFHKYAISQSQGQWLPLPLTAEDTPRRTIGFLGYGVLAADCVRCLQGMGLHNIAVWHSQTQRHQSPSRDDPPTAAGEEMSASGSSVVHYAGVEQLPAFLAQTQILCCLLPLTAETYHMLSAERIKTLPKGASIINAARGGIIPTDALVAALAEGHLEMAVCDVVEEEPLPASSPLWKTANLIITPHIAACTVPDSTAQIVADNLEHIQRGEWDKVSGIVDRTRGY
jgi:glyoxylate/hydroxypyruvate reductase